MANIYRSAIITLAVSASGGPHHGIFRHAKFAYLDRAVSDLVSQTKLDKTRCRKFLKHNKAGLPLLQRGWAHQEGLLSPRVLHLAKKK